MKYLLLILGILLIIGFYAGQQFYRRKIKKYDDDEDYREMWRKYR